MWLWKLYGSRSNKKPTFPNVRRLLGALSFTVAALLFARCEANAEPIVVGVASGRVFTGEIDRRSNHDQLWLRTEQSGISIRRPVDWDGIVVIRSAGRELSVEQLRAEIETRPAAFVKETDNQPDEPSAPAAATVAEDISKVRPKGWCQPPPSRR